MAEDKIYNNEKMIKPEKLYEIVNKQIGYKSTVLELGCAAGSFGEYLHFKRKCTVIGADISALQLNIASKKNAYEKLFYLDLNKLGNEFADYIDFFDIILLTDVIEHLTEVEHLFAKIKPLLKKDGKIIVSVPNITHQSIKLSVLLDEFDYTPCGILDSTHVKFYTAKSAKELFNSAALKIVDFAIMINDSLTADCNIDISKIPQEIIEYVKSTRCALHYQYIFVLKPDINAQKHNDRFMEPVLTQKLI